MNEATKLAIRERINTLEAKMIDLERFGHYSTVTEVRQYEAAGWEIDELREDLDRFSQTLESVRKAV